MASVLDTLVREKGKNPVLTGEPGVGKTTLALKIAQMIEDKEIPKGAEFQGALGNAIVIETTPQRISVSAQSNLESSQAAAASDFVGSLKYAEKKLGRPIVVLVDEMHMFSEPQLQALKSKS